MNDRMWQSPGVHVIRFDNVSQGTQQSFSLCNNSQNDCHALYMKMATSKNLWPVTVGGRAAAMKA